MSGTIQTSIDLLPATGAMVQLLDGTYNISSAITLDSYQTLRGCGRNTIFTATTADLDIITATGSSGSEKVGIYLADFCIDGDAGGETNDMGIYWTYVDHSKINNVWSIDNGEYGIFISYSDHNIVTGNFCISNGIDGIYYTISADGSIRGNICNSNTGDGIYAYGNRITVFGNTCNSNTDRGIYVTDTHDSTISSNTCVSNTSEGIYSACVYNSTVSQNTCNKNGTSGMFGAFDESNLSNNVCSYNDEYGLYLTGALSSSIVGNIAIGNSQKTDNTYDDIFLINVEECLISTNVCRAADEANQPRYGINISNVGCANNKVLNNDLYDDGFVTAPFNDSGTGTIYVEPGIDDTPVNGELGQPISSNWAYDHENDADPHPVYYTVAEVDAAIDTDVATHAAIKAANATLGHVIVEDASKVDVDGDGKLTLGSDVLLEADLENPPTEDESAKAPTSEWAFDHDADADAHHTHDATDYVYKALAARGQVWRFAALGDTSRTATVSSISGDTITLTTNVADQFFSDGMEGYCYLLIRNTARSENAWVKAYVDANEIQVTESTDIANWVNGNAIRGHSLIHPTPTQYTDIDVTPTVGATAKQVFVYMYLKDSAASSQIIPWASSMNVALIGQVANVYNTFSGVLTLDTGQTIAVKTIAADTALECVIDILAYTEAVI